MSPTERKNGDRIKQNIRIPIEYAEIKVDTSREELSKLIGRIIMEEEFRVQFNKNPRKIFQDVGIDLTPEIAKKLEKSPITEIVKDMVPQVAVGPIAWIVVIVTVASMPSD